MEQATWDACTDPEKLLQVVTGQASARKLRLFACACCRRVWGLLPDEHGRTAVEVAERFADGAVGQETLRQALRGIKATLRPTLPREEWIKANASLAAWYAAGPSAEQAARKALLHAGLAAGVALSSTTAAEWAVQVATLRDIFGNPLRPAPAVGPSWLAWNGGAIPKLARVIYDEGNFGDLPILADALEEAGCTEQEILEHLRGPGPHTRGCWVLDRVLDRE